VGVILASILLKQPGAAIAPAIVALTGGFCFVNFCEQETIIAQVQGVPMQTYKRSSFSLIRGIIISPFSGLLVFIVGQVFLPVWVSAILGVIVTGAIAYMAIFSENIYCELDDNGAFRFFQKGSLKNSFELGKCRIGYRRKTEWGILGNNDITLQIIDDKNEETFLDAGPLGTTRFDAMFAAMEKHAVRDAGFLSAGKNK
jgi:hypothetical protein